MTDLAVLGLSIESGDAVKATGDLQKLTTAAQGAEKAVAGLGGQAQTAGGAINKAGNEAGQTASSLGQIASSSGSAVAAIGRQTTVINTGTAAVRQHRQQLTQLSFQLNDIATGLASGQSPFTVLAQQAGQLVQVAQMGDGGVAGTFRRIAISVAALATPANVAGAAIVALGAGFLAYTALSREKLQSVDDALKGHTDLIARIKGAYGEASVAAEAYGRESKSVLSAQLQADIRGLQEQIKAANAEFNNSITAQQSYSKSGMGPRVVSGEFAPFKAEIDALRQSAVDGLPEIQRFRDEIATKIATEPATSSVRKLGEELLASTDKLSTLDGKLGQARGTMVAFGSDAATAALNVKALTKALNDMADVAKIAPTDEEQGRNAYARGLLTARTPEDFERVRAANAAAQNRIAGSLMPKPTAKPNYLGANPDGTYGGSTTEKKSALDQANAAAREQIRTAGDALVVFGRGSAAIEAYRMEQALLTAAQKDGTDATAEQAVGFKKLSDIYEKLLLSKQRMQLSSDLSFEGSQINRSPVEQNVATTMRGIYGDQYLSHMQDFEAQQIRNNAALREAKDAAETARKGIRDFEGDVIGGAFNDFFSSIRDGKDAFQALGDAAINALDKISSKLMDMAIDDMMAAMFPDANAKPGSGSSLRDFVAGVFGGGRRASVANDNAVAAVRPKPSGIGSDAVASRIKGVNGDFSGRLSDMMSDAKDAGYGITVNSGYRSVERQQQLWDAALQKYGSPEAARKWVAPPGRSMHNFGQAADLGYSSPDATDWAHQNAGKYGLKFPLGNENWHVEPIGARADLAGRSLKEMSDAAAQTAKATTGLGNGLGDLTNSVSGAASKIGQFGAGGGMSIPGFGGLGAVGGGGYTTSTGWMYANGAAFAGGRVTALANGGVVHGPTMFPMANGAGLMGEAGPEAVMPLRRLGNGRLGVETSGGSKGGGGGNLSVIVNNNVGNAQISQSVKENSHGERELHMTINEAVASSIGQRGSPTVKALRMGGFRPPVTRRGG